jgi:hypothetical protein
MALTTIERIEALRLGASPGRWARAGDWLQAAILGLAGLAPAGAAVVSTRSVTPASAILAVSGLATAGALALAVVRRDAGRAFWIGAASMGVALVGAFAIVVPRVDAIKDFRPFLLAVDAILPQGEAVRAMGIDETLLGIVPFVTGRRVIPIETKDLNDASFVLVQSSGEEPNPAGLESVYERVVFRTFGPRRRMALWRRL